MAAAGRFDDALDQYGRAVSLLDGALVGADADLTQAVAARRVAVGLALARDARRGRLLEAAERAVREVLEGPVAVDPATALLCRVMQALLGADAAAHDMVERWRAVLVAAGLVAPTDPARAREAERLAHGHLAEAALAANAIKYASIHIEALGACVDADTPERGEYLLARGRLHRLRGEVEASQEALQEALPLFGAARDTAAMARVLLQLGNLRREAGASGRARELFERALALAEPSEDPDVIAAALTDLGNALSALGDSDTARARYAEAVDVLSGAEPTPARREALIGALVNLASREAELGRVDAAIPRLEAAIDALLALGRPRAASDVGLLLGQLLARDGRLIDAERRFASALAHAEASGHMSSAARLMVSRAALAHARGDLSAAEAGYAAGIAKLLQHKRIIDAVVPALARVELALIRRDFAAARAALAGPPLAGLPSGTREADDVALMAARVDHAASSSEAHAAILAASAARLVATGRPLEGLAAVTALVDLAPRGDAEARIRLEAAVAAVPGRLEGALALEVEGLRAWHAGAAETLRALRARAAAAGLRLLALRFGRQAIEAGASDLHDTLVSEAAELGHAAELHRLRQL